MNQPPPLKLFLHYSDSSRASRRVAEGHGDLARRVQATAGERGLPLGENLDLVQLCARVDFGERLEGKLLEAIAETVGWLRSAGKTVVDGPISQQTTRETKG